MVDAFANTSVVAPAQASILAHLGRPIPAAMRGAAIHADGALDVPALAALRARLLVVANLACPVSIAVDDRCLYWVNEGTCASWWSGAQSGTGSLARVDKPTPATEDGGSNP